MVKTPPGKSAPDSPPEDNSDEVVEEAVETDDDELESLTKDQLVESFEELVTRGRSAGLRPLKVLAGTYIKQGLDVLDGLLGAFEGGKKKRGKE
tara:strand:- start:3299 stop:3580 length:282 start_codon:yes stop_codon:yes gene_type:complete